MASFSTRPYRYRIDDDAVSKLLPEAAQPWGWARSFLAEAEDGEVIGAACLVLPKSEKPRVKIQCLVTDQTDEQGQTVQEALLADIVAIARKLHWPVVWAWNAYDEHTEGLATWMGLGFETDKATFVYEVSSLDYLATTEPIYQRLGDRGKLDQPYRLEHLNASNMKAAAELRSSTVDGTVDEALHLMGDTESKGKIDTDLSSVLVIKNQIAAICLIQRLAEDLVLIDAVAVDPAWRNGWANIVVRTETNRWLLENGIKRIRFAADPKHKDTHKAARRSGAKIVEKRIRPYLRISEQ